MDEPAVVPTEYSEPSPLDEHNYGLAGAHDLYDPPNYEPEHGNLETWYDPEINTAYARWTFMWDDDHHMSSLDFFAHDLYMLNEDGTFLNIDTARIVTEATTLPATAIYKNEVKNSIINPANRLGWMSWSPQEIQLTTTYTVTIRSPIDLDTFDAEDESFLWSTLGFPLPFNCVRLCYLVPFSFCQVNEGDQDLVLTDFVRPISVYSYTPTRFKCSFLARRLFLATIRQ